ncbi:MAG: ABC transporter ATP-binding protein, partial [Salinivirgaceae bacterium]|nr:ABC transporter ATP-binding protein [Salinivirgaceae bacterium]
MLRISNLTVQFNTFKAIDNLSFSLLKGEILGIVGESGSGKSLTALSIMQLLPPNAFQSGKIEFGEQLESDLSLLSELEMQKIRGNEIAMIFQDPLSALNSSQTIGCQMTESVRVHQNVSKKEAQKQVFTLLEKVKLDPPTRFFKSYPFQLSGGQRQRILIAMALSNSPKLLIADEPTTALDVTVQKEIVDLLKGLVQQEKIVMIFISHDLALVSQIADSVLVMNSGKMVEKEVTSLLISKPKEAYTKALLKCKPTLGHEKRRLPEVSDITNSVQFDATQQPLVQNNIGEKELLRVNDLQVVFGSKRAQNRVTAVDSVSF